MAERPFRVEAVDGRARAGLLRTAHGPVPTPAFMPVATQATVKSLDPRDLRAVGAAIVLSNTYHLYLRPGVDLVHRLGGLHRFMGWDGPILTDSGGFQVFSLAHLRRLTEEAVVFRSHLDGSLHRFSPEDAVRHQEALGSDIITPLDVCVSADASQEEVEEAMERTHRWARRSLEARRRGDRLMFGIVQGGLHQDLRERSAVAIVSLGFDGYAIGGLSVGESKGAMYRTAAFTAALLPRDAPRYLMGVGSPEDLVECVSQGVDLFDCVLPTRVARNGSLFTSLGRVNIDSGRYRGVDGPVEPDCDCYTCRHFSAAYLSHLFRAGELLAYRLATIHNLRFVLRLMEGLRRAILQGRLGEFKERFLAGYRPADEAVRREQRRRWLAARRGEAGPREA